MDMSGSLIITDCPEALRGFAESGGQAEARTRGGWHGLRARPLDRPAPVLEMLQPGLVVATGHYRNGILLTPVTAEWVSEILDHNLPITGT